MTELIDALGLGEARLVAITGGGGKTSLMKGLAAEWGAQGQRVLVTTTTKIAADEAEGPWPSFVAQDAGAIATKARTALPGAGAAIAYSEKSRDGFRLVGFAPEILDALLAERAFDRIVAEADGSARLPLKAPAAHEPVIPATADAVVMVAGLIGLGQPLDRDTVFRPELFGARTGLAQGDAITPLALARILLHPQGLAQYAPKGAALCAFLNRTDDAARLAWAEETAAVLRTLAPARAIRLAWGCLKPIPTIAGRARIGG